MLAVGTLNPSYVDCRVPISVDRFRMPCGPPYRLLTSYLRTKTRPSAPLILTASAAAMHGAQRNRQGYSKQAVEWTVGATLTRWPLEHPNEFLLSQNTSEFFDIPVRMV